MNAFNNAFLYETGHPKCGIDCLAGSNSTTGCGRSPTYFTTISTQNNNFSYFNSSKYTEEESVRYKCYILIINVL